MQPIFPCPVETWHNDTYEAISPTRPELSVAGKTVVIVGGGSGIGRETALAFTAAGASKVALVGRTSAKLEETAAKVEALGGCSASVHVADVTKEDEMKAAANEIGEWDVFILSSGWCPSPASIAASELTDWYAGFDTNVKGTFVAAKSFLSTARPSAAFLTVISDVSVMPVAYLPGLSSYVTSKLAQAKILEFLAAENPEVFIATMHPGMVHTDNFNRSGATPEACPMDTVQLPAHFLVWLASLEAAFLKGRCAWANWDVEELKTKEAQDKKFSSGLFMTFGSKGLA
ncbi:hypothetical protein F5Y18DRAFT_367519 [Xylariaceae sp. FL1019]|nr:hypothetical protein F5Y18DRAFT_367519 [Xylariaceae sp. FL1019]